MTKHIYITLLIAFSCFISCKQTTVEKHDVTEEQAEVFEKNTVTINQLIANLKDASNDDVIVVSHRGDWRNAPENSLQAIQNCIDMGVDMVEIDIRKTKDGELILMHDQTINRTTKGTGEIKNFTLDSLKTFKLVDGLGVETNHTVPTLEEALLLTKDKILVNLDKSYEIFEECYKIIKKTGTLDQVVIKGHKTREEVEKEFGQYLDQVFFMPIVRLSNPNGKKIVDDYLNNHKPIAFEFTVPQDSIKMIDYFSTIRKKGSSVWVNSLWPQHNGGHDDEKAVLDSTIYDWFINNNIDIIQTDRPQILLNYLRNKGLHK